MAQKMQRRPCGQAIIVSGVEAEDAYPVSDEETGEGEAGKNNEVYVAAAAVTLAFDGLRAPNETGSDRMGFGHVGHRATDHSAGRRDVQARAAGGSERATVRVLSPLSSYIEHEPIRRHVVYERIEEEDAVALISILDEGRIAFLT